MAITLEELKQQCKQIQQHLDWLNSKIAEMEHPKGISPIETKADKPAVALASATPQVETPASTEPTEEPKPEEATKTPPKSEPSTAPAPVYTPDIAAPTYQAQTQGEVRRAKIGCFVFFILATALFLFLLFGLTNLL